MLRHGGHRRMARALSGLIVALAATLILPTTAQAISLWSFVGKVTDPLGSPIAGATVSDGSQSATTAADGTYSLGENTPGTYTLTAQAAHHAAQTQRVSGGPLNTTVNFQLPYLISTTMVTPFLSTMARPTSPVVITNWAPAANSCVSVTDSRTGIAGAATLTTQNSDGSSTWAYTAALGSNTAEGPYTLNTAATDCSSGTALTISTTTPYQVDNTPAVIDPNSLVPPDHGNTAFPSGQPLETQISDAGSGVAAQGITFTLTDSTTGSTTTYSGSAVTYNPTTHWAKTTPVALTAGHLYDLAVSAVDNAGNFSQIAQIPVASGGGFLATTLKTPASTASIGGVTCQISSQINSSGMKNATCPNIMVNYDAKSVELTNGSYHGQEVGYIEHTVPLNSAVVTQTVAGLPVSVSAYQSSDPSWAPKTRSLRFTVPSASYSDQTYPLAALDANIGTLDTQVPPTWSGTATLSMPSTATTASSSACSDPSASTGPVPCSPDPALFRYIVNLKGFVTDVAGTAAQQAGQYGVELRHGYNYPGAPNSYAAWIPYPNLAALASDSQVASVARDYDTYEAWTPTSHRWTNLDGSKAVNFTSGRSYFQGTDGLWHTIDLHLSQTASGFVGTSVDSNVATLGLTSAGAVATVGSGSTLVSVAHPDAIGATGVPDSFRTVTYSSGLSGGRTLTEALTADGFEESVTLPDAGHGDSYTDTVTLPSGVTANADSGGVTFSDSNGNVIGTFGNGTAHDSTANLHTGDGYETPATVGLVGLSGNAATIQVSIDSTWLSDPSRTFPVVIDPVYSTEVSSGNCSSSGFSSYDACDTYVNSDNYGGQYSTQTQLRSGSPGLCEQGTNCTPNRTRTLIQWPTDSYGYAPYQYPVTSAYASVYNYTDPSGNYAYTDAYGLGGPVTSSTDWSNQPASDGSGYYDTKYFANGNGWVTWNVTGLVQKWFNGSEPSYGMELQADNEYDYNAFRQYLSSENGYQYAPELLVSYIVPPTAPTSLSAWTSPETVHASWNAPSDSGGGTISSYYVSLYQSNGALIASTPTCGTCYTADFSGLQDNTSYYVTVYATNQAGPGPVASDTAVTTPIVPSSAPQNVQATVDGTEATVTWSSPANAGGGSISSYTVIPYVGGSASASGQSCTSPCTVSGLSPGTIYQFGVYATNQAGNSPTALSPATATGTAPSAPTITSATGGNQAVTVTWTAASANGSPIISYSATAYPSGSSTAAGTATACGNCTSVTVSGLKYGTTYTVSVYATNGIGNGPTATSGPATTNPGPPDPPTNVTASAPEPNGTATVNWTLSGFDGGSPIRSYSVTAFGSSNNVVGTEEVCGQCASAEFDNLSDGSTYHFGMNAVNDYGSSPTVYSGSVTVPLVTSLSTGAISGTVYDGIPLETNSNIVIPSGLTPVSGATVQIEGPTQLSTTSDANGNFNVSGLSAAYPYSQYTVVVTAPGYGTYTINGLPIRPLQTANSYIELHSTAQVVNDTPQETNVTRPSATTFNSAVTAPAAPNTAQSGTCPRSGATQYTEPSVVWAQDSDGGPTNEYNFEFYVKHVLSFEWPQSGPGVNEALRAGAAAVREVGWWNVLSNCNSATQVAHGQQDFVPNAPTYSQSDAAVDYTYKWSMKLRGGIGDANYNSGLSSADSCGQQTLTGYMDQWGTLACAKAGYKWQQILGIYFGPSSNDNRNVTVTAYDAGIQAAPNGGGAGYWQDQSDGGVFAWGNAGFYGSTGNLELNLPMVGMTSPPVGHGYWLVASDGGVFSFGNAQFHGSTGGIHLNAPIVGIAPTPSSSGYWLVASDGGIFTFGDAGFYGSAAQYSPSSPVVGMAASPDGRGYWEMTQQGHVYSFGDAATLPCSFSPSAPIVGMARAGTQQAYWGVDSNGKIYACGAPSYGDASGGALRGAIVSVGSSPSGRGYWIDGIDGTVYAYGDAKNEGQEVLP